MASFGDLLSEDGRQAGRGTKDLGQAIAYGESSCRLRSQYAEGVGQLRSSVSRSGLQFGVFKAVFWMLVICGGVWLFTVGAALVAFDAFSTFHPGSPIVANGAIYMAAFAMSLILTVAIIAPALLMLQPLHLLRVLRAEVAAVTPRQRFRGMSALFNGSRSPD